MDAVRFDDLLRALSTMPSRRGVARAVFGFALAGPLAGLLSPTDAQAKKKKGKHKRKKCKGSTRKCGKKCIPKDDCCNDGECEACESCQDGACVIACQTGQECVSGQCRCTTSSCSTGCCAGDVCADGDSVDNCGIGGEACVQCDPGLICAGTCLPGG